VVESYNILNSNIKLSAEDIKTEKRGNDMSKIEKGSKVILCGFTGIKLGVFEVSKATKDTIEITKVNGDVLTFNAKTLVQTGLPEGKQKYANSIMEDDGSYVKPVRKAKKASKAPKAKAKAKKVEDDEDYEDAEEVL
jgi:preprotein translocase subunit YajC